MSDHAAAHGGHDAGHGEHTHHGNYVRVWMILLGLLLVSVAGPIVARFIEHRSTALALTLSTAFGIAVIKAYMVAKNFMHINFAQRYIVYLVTTMVVFMFLFFAGSAPDVMENHGTNWVKPAWIEANKEAALHHVDPHAEGAHH